MGKTSLLLEVDAHLAVFTLEILESSLTVVVAPLLTWSSTTGLRHLMFWPGSYTSLVIDYSQGLVFVALLLSDHNGAR